MGHQQRGRHAAVRDRREAARERQAQREHQQAVHAALVDEVKRFNAALSERFPEIVLETAFGPYQVHYATYDLDVGCHPHGTRRDQYNMRTFQLANDDRWASLLSQAQVERHPLFGGPRPPVDAEASCGAG